MIIKSKRGYRYDVVAKVHKVPSSGKYKMQAYIQCTRPNGSYETTHTQSLTFNMKKDADEAAKKIRVAFTKIAKESAKVY